MSDTFICYKTGLEFKRIPATRGNRYQLLEHLNPFTKKKAETTEGDVYPFWMATTPICGKHVEGIEFAPDDAYGQGPVQITGSEYPVFSISYDDCTKATIKCGKKTYKGLLHYPQFQPYRLPTEFEWEWAALGGENFKYAGSPNHLKVAWTEQVHGGNCNVLQPVKLKSPNGYGLYDMSGNIFEWTSAKEGPFRVNRGGSWDKAPTLARVSCRIWLEPNIRLPRLGVRLCFSGDPQ